MTVVLTGANGFLGFHIRALLHSQHVNMRFVRLGAAFHMEETVRALEAADQLIHIAGVNRGTDDDIAVGNRMFAEQISGALRQCWRPPRTVAFANSIQAGNGSVYGDSKRSAAALLADTCAEAGVEFLDVRLPNLFGEHGRPFYNSVVATFCELLAHGNEPQVLEDRSLVLLHAQPAAQILTGAAPLSALGALTAERKVTEVRDQLKEISEVYASGDIPVLHTAFDVDLFNTYRSFLPVKSRLIPLQQHEDARGSFFEVVRNRSSMGQSSFSTTVPGVTRGEHYHLRKVERFAVLSGQARISMRRLFSNELVEFEVSASAPAAVDMPTMWAHKITNVGTDPLFTMFWSNEIYDPQSPDTFPEET